MKKRRSESGRGGVRSVGECCRHTCDGEREHASRARQTPTHPHTRHATMPPTPPDGVSPPPTRPGARAVRGTLGEGGGPAAAAALPARAARPHGSAGEAAGPRPSSTHSAHDVERGAAAFEEECFADGMPVVFQVCGGSERVRKRASLERAGVGWHAPPSLAASAAARHARRLGFGLGRASLADLLARLGGSEADHASGFAQPRRGTCPLSASRAFCARAVFFLSRPLQERAAGPPSPHSRPSIHPLPLSPHAHSGPVLRGPPLRPAAGDHQAAGRRVRLLASGPAVGFGERLFGGTGREKKCGFDHSTPSTALHPTIPPSRSSLSHALSLSQQMGPSGCGKTTLLDCLAGRKSIGKIIVRGVFLERDRTVLPLLSCQPALISPHHLSLPPSFPHL